MSADTDPSLRPYLELDHTTAETAVSVILKLRGDTRDVECLH